MINGTKIVPLKGQALVRVLPPDGKSSGGIDLVDWDPEPGEKALPRIAVVLGIGVWKQTKSGFHILPEVQQYQKVLINEYKAQKLRDIATDLRLVRIDDILAVIEENRGPEQSSEPRP